MEIPPRDQTSLGERRGGIGRREKGSRVILGYHLSLASQMVSGNPECAADASQNHLQRKKIQGRRVDIPAVIDDNRPLSVDKASRVSIERHLTVSIDAHH
ncbi:hypothetical protein F2Q69_00013798 [Brassica cretica]|uniref:Uncharacterized protein n=1 Tax=Brassica cretica TaxID=69181 RepID=A0A8S9QT88_BRACR|nr:hypothetical protein F2Q69_00013798 [Brassica cretica]